MTEPAATRAPVVGGPFDDDPDAVRRERDEAVARCRELEHELGALRGRVKRMELMAWRRTRRRDAARRWLARVAAIGRRPRR